MLILYMDHGLVDLLMLLLSFRCNILKMFKNPFCLWNLFLCTGKLIQMVCHLNMYIMIAEESHVSGFHSARSLVLEAFFLFSCLLCILLVFL